MATSSEGVVFRKEQSEDSDIWDDEALIKAYDKAVKAAKDEIVTETSKDPEQKSTGHEKKGHKKNRNKDRKLKKKKMKNKWHVGDQCRAMYTEDGVIYNAVIKSIDRDHNKCWVSYTGYGNEEEIDIKDIIPPESETESKQENGYESHQSMDWTDHGQSPAHPGYHGNPPWWQHQHPPPSPRIPPHFNPMNPIANPYFQPFPSGYPSGNPWLGAMHPGSTPPRIPPIPPPPPISQDAIDGDEEALFSMLISWYMSGYHTGYYQGLKASRTYDGGARQNTHQRESPAPSTFRQPRQQQKDQSYANATESRR